MAISQLYYVAAANYNCGAYGAGGYSTNECDTTSTGQPGGDTTGTGGSGTNTGSATGSSNSGGIAGTLADAGYEVLLPMSLALAVIIASVMHLAKRLRH